MQFLYGKNILLGVSGGIAAYKAAALVRLLKKAGADVRVVMTQAATTFVGPLTFQALSGNPVHSRLLDEQAEAGMGHIQLARWADRILIAPASANCIARLAHGLADDLLSTLCLASAAPLLLAPAMNQQMWASAQTKRNIKQLRGLGAAILGPAVGEQACGDHGPGRMIAPETLAQALNDSFANDALAGLKVMITAGPTREAIDAVRYISNRSSGKMGFALAAAAREAGAFVTLVAGPVALSTPAGVQRVDVVSAQQMGQAVLSHVAEQDILIGSAAVADYIPSAPRSSKLKKSAGSLSIELVPSMDILREVGRMARRPFTVGFAAETEQVAAYAKAKCQRKNMDMIAANEVGGDDRGFDSDDNALNVYWQGGEQVYPLASKAQLARQLIALIAKRFRLRSGDGAAKA